MQLHTQQDHLRSFLDERLQKNQHAQKFERADTKTAIYTHFLWRSGEYLTALVEKLMCQLNLRSQSDAAMAGQCS